MSAPVPPKKSTIKAGRIAFINESQALAYLGLDALGDANDRERVREAKGSASMSCQNKARNESKKESAESVRAGVRSSKDFQVVNDANNNLKKNLQRKSSAVESIGEKRDSRIHANCRVTGVHRDAEKDDSEAECVSACKKMRRLDEDFSYKGDEYAPPSMK
ncbi:hypothetical protein AAVH_15907 [Aphelenchoides avenae]|nr:hypothetical protein AAVH_15907 [Aphelenchus avenae]